MVIFVFFKQKTAYEMRISDWSSDVCSSDLPAEDRLQLISSTGVARTLWTWPDKPQTAGCAAVNGMIMVSQTRTQRLQALAAPTEEKPTTAEPVTDRKSVV